MLANVYEKYLTQVKTHPKMLWTLELLIVEMSFLQMRLLPFLLVFCDSRVTFRKQIFVAQLVLVARCCQHFALLPLPEEKICSRTLVTVREFGF